MLLNDLNNCTCSLYADMCAIRLSICDIVSYFSSSDISKMELIKDLAEYVYPHVYYVFGYIYLERMTINMLV